MDIRVLRYFLAVAREESISRAADVLHITQPTLSWQMMLLEDELGAQLFNRTNKITLTEAGVHLKLRAMEIDSLMDMLERDFSARSDVMGQLSIGSDVGLLVKHLFNGIVKNGHCLLGLDTGAYAEICAIVCLESQPFGTDTAKGRINYLIGPGANLEFHAFPLLEIFQFVVVLDRYFGDICKFY